MRERGAFGFLIIMLVAAIWLLGTGTDENDGTVIAASQPGVTPKITINGRSYEPVFLDDTDANRMVIVVDRDALSAGENTVEVRWSDAPTLTAKIQSDTSTR